METKRNVPYLPAFLHVAKENWEDFQLIGDCMLVEELPPSEVKTASGIILATGGNLKVDGFEANKPTWVRVLQVGNGYYGEDERVVDLDTNPGDIVMVGKLAVKWLSVFGPLTSCAEHNLGLVRENEVQARFRGQEGFDRYFKALQEKLAA